MWMIFDGRRLSRKLFSLVSRYKLYCDFCPSSLPAAWFKICWNQPISHDGPGLAKLKIPRGLHLLTSSKQPPNSETFVYFQGAAASSHIHTLKSLSCCTQMKQTIDVFFFFTQLLFLKHNCCSWKQLTKVMLHLGASESSWSSDVSVRLVQAVTGVFNLFFSQCTGWRGGSLFNVLVLAVWDRLTVLLVVFG